VYSASDIWRLVASLSSKFLPSAASLTTRFMPTVGHVGLSVFFMQHIVVESGERIPIRFLARAAGAQRRKCFAICIEEAASF